MGRNFSVERDPALKYQLKQRDLILQLTRERDELAEENARLKRRLSELAGDSTNSSV